MRFSFRFQKWTDVLDWFAQQSDLSLVMDNPPPGTFNYTDDREYSVSEALDLLNSVLLTKGYTLVRRNRMLLVLNTADGIPPDVVPRVTLEELDERGNFELVNVVFPLGKKDVEAVKSEISHLVSPLGSVVVLPQTKQVIVTERAGMMRAISAIIQGIPEPPQPEPKPKPPEPEKPRAYRLSDQERRSGQGAGSPDKAVCGGTVRGRRRGPSDQRLRHAQPARGHREDDRAARLQ